jgi:predicted 2-oxoglutarate/Fe(II)-dependent dioxygenase YbiX
MVEATAVYDSILAAAAVAMASPPASGQTLFNLYSENSLFSTHVDDDEIAGYVNCFSGCKSLEMHCSCWSSSHSVGRAIPGCQL